MVQFQQVDANLSLPKRLLHAPNALRKPLTAADRMYGLKEHSWLWLSVRVFL